MLLIQVFIGFFTQLSTHLCPFQNHKICKLWRASTGFLYIIVISSRSFMDHIINISHYFYKSLSLVNISLSINIDSSAPCIRQKFSHSSLHKICTKWKCIFFRENSLHILQYIELIYATSYVRIVYSNRKWTQIAHFMHCSSRRNC